MTTGARRLCRLGAVLALVVACGAATTRAEPRWRVYYGNLHAHTEASDGIGTVEEAVRYARDVAKLDVLAITDHDYFLDGPRYQRLLDLARRESGERFLLLPGFEWSSPESGHVVVLGSAQLTDARRTRTVRELIGFARSQHAVLVVAHPALLGRPERTFREIEGNDVIVGVEIGSGYDWPSSGYAYRRYDLDVVTALAKGWRLGVGIGQDNHHGFWGDVPIDPSSGKGRAGWIGILAPSLTRDDVMAAIRRGHTFATEDRALRLVLRANGRLMGETVSVIGALRFTVEAAHPALARARVILYEDNYENPIAVMAPSGATLSETVTHVPDARAHAYFVRVELADGRLAWSSPILRLVAEDLRAIAVWTEPEVPLAGRPFTIRATLVNRGTRPARGVRYRIYDAERSQPISEGQVDVGAGAGGEVAATYAPPAGTRQAQLRLALLRRPGDDVSDNTADATVVFCPRADAAPVTVEVTREFGTIAVTKTSASAAPCALAVEALQRAATIEYSGGLVHGIDGTGSAADNIAGRRYWCFAINGVKATEGVGTYRVKPGDALAFDLHAWTAEDPTARSCTKRKIFRTGAASSPHPTESRSLGACCEGPRTSPDADTRQGSPATRRSVAPVD